MKISFYKRGGFLQARISDKSKTIRISTGKNEMSNREIDQHKKELVELYLKYGSIGVLKDHFNSTTDPDSNDYTLDGLIKMYLYKMKKGEIVTKSGRPFSQDSIRTYAYVSNTYSEFASSFKGIKLPDFHIDASWPINRKQKIGEAFNSYFKKLDEWMIERNNGMKSRFNVFNIISIITAYWSSVMFLNIPKIARTPNVSKPIVTFTPEFVMRFLRDEDNVYQALEPEKKMVWEISATILITTMRVGDVISLRESDFNIVRDTMFINKRNRKTNAISQSPLPRFLSDKYRENLARFGRIYTTVPSKNKIYEHMKDMFKMYEDLHEWFTVSKLGIRGEPVTETKPLYEWAHPHLLRKTAITTMIANKVPDRHIKFLSGHAENSASYGYYIGHVEKHYQSDMIDYFNKNYN